ncbi:MAG TPA: hypothetical protein K8V56_11595 [Sporosarcina psychrophila]|uniref:Prepilin-type N-terminal cleavage/methylation domain-containing protein n=1 Tax=Sporosarcina psychrophila TaxID=1476 RepID=A0A921G0H6_SPOPS|nr:hypothetical protein [Sporosarcina psychrophila]
MEKFKLKKGLGENGLSLVEVLASFVILTLLLTTFLMMFIQSAKVNKSSEHIIEATYIAQTEMENIYALSTSFTREAAIKSLVDYTKEPDVEGWTVFNKLYSPDISIKVKLKNKTGEMDRVLVEVIEPPSSNTPKAQMENVIIWRAD